MKKITCGKCRISFTVEKPFRGERLKCPDCRRWFRTKDTQHFVRMTIDTEDAADWGYEVR